MINLSSIVHWMNVLGPFLGLFGFSHFVFSLPLSLLLSFFLLCLCRNEFIMTTKTRRKNKLQESLESVQQLCHYFLKHKNLSEIYTNCTRFVFVRIKEIAMIFMFFFLFFSFCSFSPQRLHLLSVCLSVCMYVRFSAFPFCAAFSQRFINIWYFCPKKEKPQKLTQNEKSRKTVKKKSEGPIHHLSSHMELSMSKLLWADKSPNFVTRYIQQLMHHKMAKQLLTFSFSFRIKWRACQSAYWI